MRKKSLLFIKIVSLTIVITMLFASCSSGVKIKTVKAPMINEISAVYSGDENHRSVEGNFKSVCKSGLIELLFDEKTMTTAVRDTNSGNLWTTLPTVTSKQLPSSAVEVVLSNGDGSRYTLNSQDNALAFGNASYELSEDGVAVKYSIAPDAETGKADIAALTEKQIRVDLTVLYTLKDGSFYVNVSMNTLKVPEGVYLEKVRLLSDFGAYEQSGADDYIFVPDGSGALIMTGVEDAEFKPVSLPVYGSDKALGGNDSKSSCLVGAFGMKRGNGAFLCIVEQGDTIADINAYRNGETSLNSVGASFKTTDISTEQGKKNIKTTYGSEYKNEIRLCYRFLSGKSATYSGMATACRENLIRNSVLSTKKVTADSESLPLILSVQGGYINENGKYLALSDYEKTQSLLTLLKAKGVNNIYLRYNGLHKDANNGNRDFGDFKGALGSKAEYDALYGYMTSQKFSMFIDTDILTYDYDGSSSAKSVGGSSLKGEAEISDVSELLGTTKAQSYSKISDIEDIVENILYASEGLQSDGYALNDMGSYLYSDYSSDFYSREGAKKEISAQTPVIATAKKLMLDTGNFYAVKSADIITEIPMSPAVGKETPAYRGIPFVQMMLHGISEYSAAGINTNGNPKTAFLKSVEYGCLPSAEWYCTKYNEVLDKKYYYDSNINDIVSFYIKADSILANLRSARMTAHYEVQDGLFCTEYNNSSKVYVNFTDKPITVNGITVSAEDCIQIS